MSAAAFIAHMKATLGKVSLLWQENHSEQIALSLVIDSERGALILIRRSQESITARLPKLGDHWTDPVYNAVAQRLATWEGR